MRTAAGAPRAVRLLTVAATICCCWAPSLASAASGGAQLGYALTAVGFKSYFVFDARPGRTATGTLRIESLTPGAKTIRLSPVDVTTAATGGLQYGDHSPRGDGRWLKLAARSVRVSGSGTAGVRFTVRVPVGAGAGDHFVGIIALDRRVLSRTPSGSGPIRLRLIPRLAMTIQLRLPGARTSALAVGAAKIDVAPSGAALTLAISNPSNTLITASTGDVTVSQGGTPLFTRTIDLAGFVPNTTISYRVPWEGTPVQGTYQVKGELRPTGAAAVPFQRTVTFGGAAIRKFRRDTGRQAKESPGTPLALIAGFAIALLAAIGFGVAYARIRRQAKRR